MDSDNANLSKAVAKKVESIIDLAIVDIFNSKKRIGKIADPNSPLCLIPEVKERWIKLSDEEKAYLTEVIKQNNSKKHKNINNAVTNYELVYYFLKYILPYSKQVEVEVSNKSLMDTLIWSNDVLKTLKTIEAIEFALENRSVKRSHSYMNNLQADYENAVNKFYTVYANPSKKEKRILKLKLMLNKKLALLEHLLKERNTWQEVLDNCKISWKTHKNF